MNEYISLKVILDRILRHPLMQELQFEAAVDYTVDFMRIVGTPKMFEEKVSKIEVKNYRADLSELNIYKVLGIKYNNQHLQYTGDIFITSDNSEDESTPKTEVEILKYNGYNTTSITPNSPEYLEIENSFKYNGTFEIKNSLNAYYHNNEKSLKDCYKIQNNVLFTNIEKGELEIAYLSIPMIDDYPAILDNSSYLRALELYIKKQWFTILFDMGKIQAPVLQNIQQEYAWAVGDCESEFNRMSLDQAEYFYNSMKNILNDRHQAYGFKYLGR